MKRARGAIASRAASMRRRALTRMSASTANRANSASSNPVVAAISTDPGRNWRKPSTAMARAGSISRTLGMDRSWYDGGTNGGEWPDEESTLFLLFGIGGQFPRHAEQPGG